MIVDQTAEVYDFNITWNMLSADESRVMEKLDSIGKLMATYDKNGVSRFDVYLRKVLEAVDPNLADELILPQQEATEKEVAETSLDLAKIASGQVVDIPQQGINPQLRLQVLQSYLQGTAELPATDVQKRLQEDEAFAKRIQQYSSQLEFVATQQKNALIGRLGTAPGNMPASAV